MLREQYHGEKEAHCVLNFSQASCYTYTSRCPSHQRISDHITEFRRDHQYSSISITPTITHPRAISDMTRPVNSLTRNFPLPCLIKLYNKYVAATKVTNEMTVAPIALTRT